jgi:flagellar biosynthesis/type III secretory pathway protein FliH
MGAEISNEDQEEAKDLAYQALGRITDLCTSSYDNGYKDGYKQGFELGVLAATKGN